MSIEENLTRVYTINLGRAWITPEHKRTDRVVNMIREFAQKHMKSKDIRLDQALNNQVWARGKTNPPRKVRVKMVKDDDDIVTVSLYEEVTESAAPAPETPPVEQKPEETQAEVEEEKSAEIEAETKEEPETKDEEKPAQVGANTEKEKPADKQA